MDCRLGFTASCKAALEEEKLQKRYPEGYPKGISDCALGNKAACAALDKEMELQEKFPAAPIDWIRSCSYGNCVLLDLNQKLTELFPKAKAQDRMKCAVELKEKANSRTRSSDCVALLTDQLL